LGSRLTVADMKLMHWIPWIQSGGLPAFPPSCLVAYPHVVALVRTISNMPAVHAFYQTHSVPYEDFDFVPIKDTIDDQWLHDSGAHNDTDEPEDVLALVDRISALPSAKQDQGSFHDNNSGTTMHDWQVDVDEDVTVGRDEGVEVTPTRILDDVSLVSGITEDNWALAQAPTDDNDDDDDEEERPVTITTAMQKGTSAREMV
jgi:hypothetical protein